MPQTTTFRSPRHVSAYSFINLIFAGLIGLGFLYVGLLGNRTDATVGCFYRQQTGQPCPSCGFTRGFHALLHGQREVARQLNPHVESVFLFFAGQGVLRVALLLLFWRRSAPEKLIWLDGGLSLGLFALLFGGLIEATLRFYG